MTGADRELHHDRVRAGSFGSVAGQYDQYRPTYPDALISDLIELQPARVLDVGCGTGKVAVALANRGLSVLGVEPDERMAEVARRHRIAVEVAAFETWDDTGRTFDLITCGDAWHWIDPDRGAAKAAEVLNPGGTIARFWTAFVVSDSMIEALDLVYRRHAPEVAQVWRPSDGTPWFHASGADPLSAHEAFRPTELRTYQWDRIYRAEEWVGLAGTISDHQRLGPERLNPLLQEVRTAVEKAGGSVLAHHETSALLTRRV